MTARRMRLGLSIRGHGYHPAAWRHPDVPADGTLHVEHYVRSAQTAERGKLDMIFFADGAGIRQGDTPPGSLSRTGRDMVELEPMTLLPALAMVTSHVGLVTTASTTYNEPYNLARKFATLDLISKGRAGWNVVASWSELEAQNFGLETTLDYDTRYARSAEFVEVVKGLWDSWDDGALAVRQGGRPVFRRSQDACAGSPRAVLQGARSAQRRRHAAGPSGDRAGRRFGTRAASWAPRPPRSSTRSAARSRARAPTTPT